MEQFTFSFEDLIRFFRSQQRNDYEGIDVILSVYDTTILTGLRRQYSITAILMELGLHPTQTENEEPVQRKRIFSIEGNYQRVVCELMNQHIAFNVFLN